jgi:hypothetical protein
MTALPPESPPCEPRRVGVLSMRDPHAAVDVELPGDRASEEVARSDAPQLNTPSPGDGRESPTSSAATVSHGSGRRLAVVSARIGTLVRAIQDNEEAGIEEAILRSRPPAEDIRAARKRRLRVRDAVRRTQAARYHGGSHSYRFSRRCGSGSRRSTHCARATRQELHRAAWPGPDSGWPADDRDHDRELVPDRRGPEVRPAVAEVRPRRCRGSAACVLDDRRNAMGTPPGSPSPWGSWSV